VALSNETPSFNPAGKVFWTTLILFFIFFDSSTVDAPLFA